MFVPVSVFVNGISVDAHFCFRQRKLQCRLLHKWRVDNGSWTAADKENQSIGCRLTDICTARMTQHHPCTKKCC